jgi:hypothetical protein
MKRLLSLIAVAGILTFVACGPSAEEKAKAEKAKQDSLQAVDQARIQDSIAKEGQKTDSIAKLAEAAKADSMAKAEEAAKTAKPAKKGKK